MSHNASHVIIDGLVATGKFPPPDHVKLNKIAEKNAPRCSFRDAFTVARIVFRRLRSVGHD